MKKSIQIVYAFGFGVVFVCVMLGVALFLPYPSEFQYFTFRVVLALAAGGVAAMLPGFVQIDIPVGVRGGGALAAFVAVYFLNPAALSLGAAPTGADGLFVKELEQDGALSEYYWKQADVWFRFPKDGWIVSTKAAESGLGDLTIKSDRDAGAQIQMHVSVLDGKYRDNWDDFQTNVVSMWKATIEQLGRFDSKSIYLDGRKSFEMTGTIKGEVQGAKAVTLTYAPLGDNRVLELHLTRDIDHALDAEFLDAYNQIVSTIKFDRE